MAEITTLILSDQENRWMKQSRRVKGSKAVSTNSHMKNGNLETAWQNNPGIQLVEKEQWQRVG